MAGIGFAPLQERARRDEALYEKFGRPLEPEHQGKFVAISTEGETIVAEDSVEVLRAAIERFGSGNFAFHRIGFKAIGKWRR
ncbi:MAG: hypothetical protein ACUVV0_10870 [Anaerolineae bacterium]